MYSRREYDPETGNIAVYLSILLIVFEIVNILEHDYEPNYAFNSFDCIQVIVKDPDGRIVNLSILLIVFPLC